MKVQNLTEHPLHLHVGNEVQTPGLRGILEGVRVNEDGLTYCTIMVQKSKIKDGFFGVTERLHLVKPILRDMDTITFAEEQQRLTFLLESEASFGAKAVAYLIQRGFNLSLFKEGMFLLKDKTGKLITNYNDDVCTCMTAKINNVNNRCLECSKIIF